jgi:hypothetical protein
VFSQRFQRPIVFTRHASERMQSRNVGADLVLKIIDTGYLRYSDPVRLWAWLELPDRQDNLLRLALVLEDAVVVKTVMHHWEVIE